jgi:ankyrin repeat protein
MRRLHLMWAHNLWDSPSRLAEPGKLPTDPLLRSVALGGVEEVRLQLEQRADVNAPGNPGSPPPLVEAARYGHVGVIRLLMEWGADIDGGFGGITPLMEAARHGQTETVTLLLEHGADVHRGASDRSTALHWAALSGNPRTVRILLEAGADPTALSDAGLTPTAVAGQRKYLTLWQRLRGLPDPNYLEMMQLLEDASSKKGYSPRKP